MSAMNQLTTEFAPRPVLDYPFNMRWSPEPGVPFEVTDGVFWLRVPLPIALDHINLWILRDGDGWTLVDSGYDAQICKDVWENVFDGFLTLKGSIGITNQLFSATLRYLGVKHQRS